MQHFEQGHAADALTVAEGLCRLCPTAAEPAVLRARILQSFRPALAPRAWEAAWACDPENPSLQDAMLRAWSEAGAFARVYELAAAFLVQRCCEGTHEPLAAVLQRTGRRRVGACWRDEAGIEGVCYRWNGPDKSACGEVTLLATDDQGNEHSFSVPADGSRFKLPVSDASGTWSVAFADAPGEILQGSPIVFPELVPVLDGRRRLPRATPAERTVDIVVPVYKDAAAVQACIRSVIASLLENKIRAQIIVVDDASPEPQLSNWLDDLARGGWITLLRNRFNLGFIEAVNRALRVGGVNDVLLLNADTQVHGDWIDRLARALDSAPDIASVMPWSNNGEIGNLAPFPASTPDASTLKQIDLLASRQRAKGTISDQVVPTCSGFAMLMRREAIDDVGHLDGAGLVRGYLEEVDWCLRARAAGWRHLLATGVFIAHKGSTSFKSEKKLRVRQNRATVAARYPQYYPEYARFMSSDPLASSREPILGALANAKTGWPQRPGKQRATSAVHSGAALPVSCTRIGVWQTQACQGTVLALARQISKLPPGTVRLLLFGRPSEPLWHTGVVDVAPPLDEAGDPLIDDIALLGLSGCSWLLCEPGASVPAGIGHTVLDQHFNPDAWLAQRIAA